jgi:CRP/FNR family transcriptional regulator
MNSLKNYLPQLPEDLLEELETHSIIQEFEPDKELLREGQYVKYVPLLLSGLIKVYTRFEERELLLYYISRGESCIMSFNAGITQHPSRVFAVIEENAVLLLMPSEKLPDWVKRFPVFASFFFSLYNERYEALLDTINHLLYNRLDQRLYNYLLEESRRKNTKVLDLRHHQIAAELGTAREVISRVMKKLEHEKKVRQHSRGIEIL